MEDWRGRGHRRHHCHMPASTSVGIPADYHWQPGDRPDLLVLCDHASRALPAEYGDLGLDTAARAAHICWDIGAAELASSLGAQLGAAVLSAGWSRILIDCNRGWDDPTLVLPISDGISVPGNQRVDAVEREQRWRRYHQPYHEQIRLELDRRITAGQRPLLLGIHSFTPVYAGQPRPWEMGILWRPPDPRAAAALGFLSAKGLVVGDNEPYSGADMLGHTLERHAIDRGLPYLLIEVRQDLLDAAGVARFTPLLSECVEAVLRVRDLK